MELLTVIKERPSGLTDLECSIVEAHAIDRYTRYLKAAKELDEMTAAHEKRLDDMGRDLTAEEMAEADKTWYKNLRAIQRKYDLPEMKESFFGDGCYADGCAVNFTPRLDLQRIKRWINAASFGKMTEFQLECWIEECDEFDYMDPFWIMFGIPYFWVNSDNTDPKAEETFEGIEETLKVFCTHNSSKAQNLPNLGYCSWGEPKAVYASAKKYWMEFWQNRMDDAKAKKLHEEIERLKREKAAYEDFGAGGTPRVPKLLYWPLLPNPETPAVSSSGTE